MNSATSPRQPSISVVIPVFNDEQGVLATLDGLAGQDYPMDRFEAIVVDNASQPPTRISNDYPFHTRIVRCSRPGSYAARNAGVQIASGDVLAFTDADCVPDPAWLKTGAQCLMEKNARHFVGGEVAYFKPQKRTTTALYQVATGFGQKSNLRDKHFTVTANLFCTAQQFKHVGPFDERLLSGGDREWAWRAIERGFTARFEPEALVRTHPRYRLRSAVRQARRVAAGRKMLRQLKLTHAGPAALARQRSPWQSLVFLLTCPELSLSERLRVLGVAIVLRAVYAVENLRLRLGSTPERR